jgi:hypothetical protein
VNVAVSEPKLSVPKARTPKSRWSTTETAVGISQNAWESVRRGGSAALNKLLNGFGNAVQRSENRRSGVRMIVVIDPQRRVPVVKIEDVDHLAIVQPLLRLSSISTSAKLLII